MYIVSINTYYGGINTYFLLNIENIPIFVLSIQLYILYL